MTTATKQLQREFAAMSDRRISYFLVDVYGDRVNFIVTSRWIYDFFTRRGIITDRDRGGYSISIKDAQSLGIPTEIGTYRVYRDSRRKWEKR